VNRQEKLLALQEKIQDALDALNAADFALADMLADEAATHEQPGQHEGDTDA
jgi:hypothetical protein